MKKLLFFLIFLPSLIVEAQIKGNVGDINENERVLKVCAFDPEAAAVVLTDEGFSDYTDDYNLQTFRRTKIKILKEDGIREYADFYYDYYSKNDNVIIDDFDAVVTNYDENGKVNQKRVDKKSVYRKKINDDYTRISVAFPDVKVGSIIDFRYRYYAKHYGFLKNWYFQREIPVYKSCYELRMVPNLEITYLAQNDPRYELAIKPIKSINAISFSMNEIPALTNEPYMDARENYVQKVIFQITKFATSYGVKNYMSTWNELTRDLYERNDFGRQIKLKIDECQNYLSSLEGKSDFEKMKAIHAYILKNTDWNNERALVSEGVRTLWKNKTGNSADVNLLMINLLKHAGLEVYPMLVSERGNGRINRATPFTDQFNNVYAAVFIGNQKYYLDGTDEFTPVQQVPFSILNTTAYIVDVKKGGLVDINETEVRYRDLVVVQAKLEEDGRYCGKVLLSSKDYARSSRMWEYKKEEREKYISKYIVNGMANVTVDSLKINNEDNDSLPLNQVFNYNTYVQQTGDYSFVNLNMFSGIESNPFLLKNRFSAINFGYNRTLNLNCNIMLPKTVAVDALPKNIKLKNADGSVVFTRELFYDEKNRILVARIKVDINKSFFEVDEYPSVQEFYKKMIDLLNEQVVLKKV